MKWLVNTRENMGWGALDLRIALRDFDHSLHVVLPFALKRYEPNVFVDALTINAGERFDGREFLQACVDHAAEIGIFPTKITAPTRELDAIKYHLEDMRKLVFK